MAIEEYYVLLGPSEEVAHIPSTTWNGAAAGAEIYEPKENKAIKNAKIVVVQAESAAEAIRGAKQVLPDLVSGGSYGILKSSLTTG
jgi:hypothetical protein